MSRRSDVSLDPVVARPKALITRVALSDDELAALDALAPGYSRSVVLRALVRLAGHVPSEALADAVRELHADTYAHTSAAALTRHRGR